MGRRRRMGPKDPDYDHTRKVTEWSEAQEGHCRIRLSHTSDYRWELRGTDGTSRATVLEMDISPDAMSRLMGGLDVEAVADWYGVHLIGTTAGREQDGGGLSPAGLGQ